MSTITFPHPTKYDVHTTWDYLDHMFEAHADIIDAYFEPEPDCGPWELAFAGGDYGGDPIDYSYED